MKLLVFVEVGADVRIPPQSDPRSGRVRGEWLVRELDPAGTRALNLALAVKTAQPGVDVTVVHLGPAANEPWLRWVLARGCDRAARVWDEEAARARVAGKSLILAAAAQATGFDLLLCGAQGVLAASGQLGVLLAEHLGVRCVTQVVDIAPQVGAAEAPGATSAGRVELTRALEGGFRERVEAQLPVVATVAAGAPAGGAVTSPDVPAAALLAAREAEVPVWDLADLGVPFDRIRQADEALRASEPRPLRPRLHPLPAPDPSLPAFDRILRLIEGVVQRRAGRVVRKPAEEIVEEVFQTLRDDGWLDHLRPGAGPTLGRDGGRPEDGAAP